MNKEIWKPVAGWEDLYEVSNLGRVKRIEREVEVFRSGYTYKKVLPEKLMKFQTDKYGYTRVLLNRGKKKKHFTIHRMVLLTFVGEKKGKEIINHINEIKTDNRLSNLEWCTHQYNINYGNRNEKVSKKLSVNVIALCPQTGIQVMSFDSVTQVYKSGYSKKNVLESNKTKRPYKGVIWCYLK